MQSPQWAPGTLSQWQYFNIIKTHNLWRFVMSGWKKNIFISPSHKGWKLININRTSCVIRCNPRRNKLCLNSNWSFADRSNPWTWRPRHILQDFHYYTQFPRRQCRPDRIELIFQILNTSMDRRHRPRTRNTPYNNDFFF